MIGMNMNLRGIASTHGLTIVARVSLERKAVDITKLLKRKKPFSIGKFEFDSHGTWKNHGEPNDDYRYGVTIDGWGDFEKPCIALFDRSQYDATTPAIDVYSVDLNSVEPLQRVIDELTSITERAKKMNKRKPRS